MSETVTLHIDTFRKMDETCRDYNKNLRELENEISELRNAKSILTLNRFPGGGREYYIKDREKVEEILGNIFTEIEGEKRGLEDKLEYAEEVAENSTYKMEAAIECIKEVSQKWWYKLFGKNILKSFV